MKKYLKAILTSSLLATAFGALTLGTTFALFTSQAKTEIEIESGLVKIEQSLQIVSVSELNDVVVVADSSGVYTNSIGGKTYVDSLNTGLVHLEKWVPGDKATIRIDNINKSNVAIKARFVTNHTTTSTPDLYEALKLTYSVVDQYENDISYKYNDWYDYAPASDPSTGYLLSKVLVTIEFPDTDNGAIVFGEANQDNKYQNTNCAISFTQEAVQGNAYAPNDIEKANEILEASATVNPTMHDALLETGVTPEEAYAKHFIWDSAVDKFLAEDDVATPSERYFKPYKSMPASTAFSVYACTWSGITDVDLDGIGFDAGYYTGLATIDYVNTSGVAKTVIIRTNDGLLTVNASQDTVKHYNYANLLTIYAVANNSYHEYGSVGEAQLQSGRLVVEKGGFIGELNEAGAGSKTIVVEGVVGKADVETPISGDGSYNDHISEDEDVNIIKVYTFDQFQQLANLCNEGVTYKGLTIQLQNDIDFEGKAWTPFGRYAYRLNYGAKHTIVIGETRVFEGTIDGNNHSIIKLSNVGFVAPTFLEEANPIKADMNFGLIACATGDVTIKDLTVNYDFKAVSGQSFEGVGLVARYLPMELTPISKLTWNADSGEWIRSNHPSYDPEHKTYALKGAELKFSNVKTTGTISGSDGVGAFLGLNYCGRHLQSVDDLGIYNWRSFKWACQTYYEQYYRDSDNVVIGQQIIEEYAKSNLGLGWYSEPFWNRSESNPELTFTYKGANLFSSNGNNSVGYAPIMAKYTFDHCINEANVTATEMRAAAFIGKFSCEMELTGISPAKFIACSNSGNIYAPERVGIISGYGSENDYLDFDYEGNVTNTGEVRNDYSTYTGDDALLPHKN